MQSPVLLGNLAIGTSSCSQIVLPPSRTPPSLLPNWSTLTMEQKLDALMVKVSNTEQIATSSNDSLNSIIPVIKQHSAAIAEHNARLLTLESSSQNRIALPTADLVIDNLPISTELVFPCNHSKIIRRPKDP